MSYYTPELRLDFQLDIRNHASYQPQTIANRLPQRPISIYLSTGRRLNAFLPYVKFGHGVATEQIFGDPVRWFLHDDYVLQGLVHRLQIVGETGKFDVGVFPLGSAAC